MIKRFIPEDKIDWDNQKFSGIIPLKKKKYIYSNKHGSIWHFLFPEMVRF